MVDTNALYRIGLAAEEAGNFLNAIAAYERCAALGNAECLSSLALLYDTGAGVEADKATAMRLYQRAWRMSRSVMAGNNIAVLYRERREWRAMFQWWQRIAAAGDGSGHLEMAKCYLRGRGVRRNLQLALRCLATAESADLICEYDREMAQRLLRMLRPRLVAQAPR